MIVIIGLKPHTNLLTDSDPFIFKEMTERTLKSRWKKLIKETKRTMIELRIKTTTYQF